MFGSEFLNALLLGVISGIISGLYTGCVINEASRFESIKQRTILMIKEWTQKRVFDLVYQQSLTEERKKFQRVDMENIKLDFYPIKYYDSIYTLDINCLAQEFLKLGHTEAFGRVMDLHGKYREIYNSAKYNDYNKTNELHNAYYQEYLFNLKPNNFIIWCGGPIARFIRLKMNPQDDIVREYSQNSKRPPKNTQ